MQEHYGIDLADPGLLERRSARWLQARIRGLLTRPLGQFTVGTRFRHALYPPKEEG